jgi:DNA (cytosine-5)-methyltransferase 1
MADSSNTLNNFDLGDTRTTHAVVQPIEPKIIKTSELRLTGKITEQETCPTLTAGAKGGDSEPLAITFQPGNLRRDAGADPSTQATTTLKASSGDQVPHVAYPINTMTLGGRPDPVNDARMTMGVGANGDAQFTLQAAHSHAVAYSINPQGVDLYNQAMTGDIHCPLRTNGHGHGAPAVMAFDAFNQTVSTTSQTLSCSASDVNHTGAVYSPTMAVRRLTPVECERLQGFPDNYSQIPWKGKPASECPDGPRYKACGNSMAVPVMRWIGERIQKQIDGTL